MSRRSREIGWGPAEITLWEIQNELACNCKPPVVLLSSAPTEQPKTQEADNTATNDNTNPTE